MVVTNVCRSVCGWKRGSRTPAALDPDPASRAEARLQLRDLANDTDALLFLSIAAYSTRDRDEPQVVGTGRATGVTVWRHCYCISPSGRASYSRTDEASEAPEHHVLRATVST